MRVETQTVKNPSVSSILPWFNARCQLCHTYPCAHSPHGIRERIGGVKVEELLG